MNYNVFPVSNYLGNLFSNFRNLRDFELVLVVLMPRTELQGQLMLVEGVDNCMQVKLLVP